MASKSLADLLSSSPTPPPRPAPEAVLAPEPDPPAAAPARPQRSASARKVSTRSRKASAKTASRASSASGSVPKYLGLERKDVRLRADQLDDLDDLVRQVNRNRPVGEGERITINTLIRIGIDLLLDRADQLDGITESDLLQAARGHRSEPVAATKSPAEGKADSPSAPDPADSPADSTPPA